MKKTNKGKLRIDNSIFITLGILFILLVMPISVVFLENSQQTLQYASTTQPNPIGPSGSWQMLYDDEFNATTLNTTVWTPGWFGTGISGPVNSAETACYNSNQA